MLNRAGVQLRPIANSDSNFAGLRVQWKPDTEGTIRGTLVSARIDGRDVSFFIANERDLIQQAHLHGRFYEEEELGIIARHFEGGVFVDVGCNIGNHAVYALKFLNADRVIAFEPNPAALRVLTLNVAANELNDRIVIHKLGLSDRAGRASFDSPVNNLGGTRLTPHDSGEGLELATGDSVLAGQQVDFIKIDTEGLEIEVLRGLTETIVRCKPRLFVEVEDVSIPQFQSFCAGLNYRTVETYKRYAVNTNFLIVPSAA